MAKLTIPQIRRRMYELADELDCDELNDLATDTFRNSPVTRAAPSSATLTPVLAERIRRFHKNNPRLHQREIAHRFNVNPGRVSEALTNQK